MLAIFAVVVATVGGITVGLALGLWGWIGLSGLVLSLLAAGCLALGVGLLVVAHLLARGSV